jgi:hypothetical protein
MVISGPPDFSLTTSPVLKLLGISTSHADRPSFPPTAIPDNGRDAPMTWRRAEGVKIDAACLARRAAPDVWPDPVEGLEQKRPA